MTEVIDSFVGHVFGGMTGGVVPFNLWGVEFGVPRDLNNSRGGCLIGFGCQSRLQLCPHWETSLFPWRLKLTGHPNCRQAPRVNVCGFAGDSSTARWAEVARGEGAQHSGYPLAP